MAEYQMVSVIIPTYNRALLIKESIQSVFNQTHRPIECLIIDDGSTDNTAKVIGNLQTKLATVDFKLIYIKQDNSGAPASRNNGIKNASGEFFQFLDSDDLLYPNKIKDQVSILQNQKQTDGVYGNWHHGLTVCPPPAVNPAKTTVPAPAALTGLFSGATKSMPQCSTAGFQPSDT